ncbi:hypothetical protein HU200_001401 [Digitaria exilis]|uniref:Uncharacterized protein n=1 Tax=Digitaria exilis TaxID=1010633 RepID=A0A835G0G6_9POAL|nr:hypothetical protein HU200_001401 [Digitaria exilis]
MHRLDVSKHLFYPTTVEAEQAHFQGREGDRQYNGGKPKPLRIERLRRLPAPIAGFESSDWCPTTLYIFVLLNGGHGEPGGRILHANNHGQTALCDTETRTVVCVSDLGMPKGPEPMTFVIPAPALGKKTSTSQTICVSSMYRAVYEQGQGTFCFDTETRQWWHAGDWKLPFYGRGEYVPELETWVGFTPSHPHHLCSSDLAGVATMAVSHRVPTPEHVWEDFTPPSTVMTARFPGNVVRRKRLEWTAENFHMVRLGSGRLCIVKVFYAKEMISSINSIDNYILMVLVGVEVVRGGDGELRMVKHKTKRFVFPGSSINCVL